MPRLSIEDLQRIREQAQPVLAVRSGTARAKVTVHMGTCGIKAGARDVVKGSAAGNRKPGGAGRRGHHRTLRRATAARNRWPRSNSQGGRPSGYGKLDGSRIAQIFKEHVLQGRVVTEFTIARLQ